MDDTVAAAAELSGKLWSPMAAAAATGGSTFKATFDAQDTPSAFNGLLERSQNIAYELYNNAAYAANMSADGYLNTMEERRRQLEASVSYTASMISNAFNSALGIASPSKKFGWAAEMSVAGYINTINDSLPEMQNAGRTMAESAVTPFEQYLSEHSVSPEVYATAAIGTADRISNRGNTQKLEPKQQTITVNLNGLSIGNVNSEETSERLCSGCSRNTKSSICYRGRCEMSYILFNGHDSRQYGYVKFLPAPVIAANDYTVATAVGMPPIIYDYGSYKHKAKSLLQLVQLADKEQKKY